MAIKAAKGEEIQESDLQNLAENLGALLKSRNLNANQLAQILDIPMMTIRRLLSGETTDPRISTLKLLANYFGATVDLLIANNNHAIAQPLKKTKPHLVPKLDWEVAKKITAINQLDLSQWKEWQSISLREGDMIGKNAFALESRPSMYPRFPQGTIFIIDPTMTPVDGDIVLIKLKKENDLTLRELTIDPPEWRLYPIVPSSNIIHFVKEEHEIIGITLLTMFYNRKNYD